jgi:hypothetical protein
VAGRARQAKKKKPQWPYDWVNGVDYPHKDQRGTVTGQLVLNDPQAATTKLPNLTVGLAHPDYTGNAGGFARAGNGNIVTWAHDGNYYQFWTDGADDGKFTITNVRPGTYTLHAFADGVLGEFAQTNITVEAGKNAGPGQARLEARALRQADLGDRLPRPHRRQILQGRRRQLLALGLGPALRAALPQRHHLHHRQERLPQGLVLRGGAARHHHRLEESRRQGPANQRFGWVN